VFGGQKHRRKFKTKKRQPVGDGRQVCTVTSRRRKKIYNMCYINFRFLLSEQQEKNPKYGTNNLKKKKKTRRNRDTSLWTRDSSSVRVGARDIVMCARRHGAAGDGGTNGAKYRVCMPTVCVYTTRCDVARWRCR